VKLAASQEGTWSSELVGYFVMHLVNLKFLFGICSNYGSAQQSQMPVPGGSPTVNHLTKRTEEETESDATQYKTPLLRKPWPLEFFLVVHFISPRSEVSTFCFIFRVNVSLTICGL
jgi:hypothetical protein